MSSARETLVSLCREVAECGYDAAKIGASRESVGVAAEAAANAVADRMTPSEPTP